MSHWPYILLPTTKPNDDRLSLVTNGTRADENSDGLFAALFLQYAFKWQQLTVEWLALMPTEHAQFWHAM
jgi:hypothetical protein